MADSKNTNNPKHVYVHNDGAAELTAKPQITEKEIHDERQIIIQGLDAAYLNLTDTMKPFQKEWDTNPIGSLADAALAGAKAGVSGWGEDFAELFQADTWISLGGKVKDAAGNAYDTASVYSVGVKNDIFNSVNRTVKHIDNPSETLFNWAWWEAELDKEKKNITTQAEVLKAQAASYAKTAKDITDKTKKIYQHRNEILNLPNLIAEGDPKPIQRFIDTTLMDIDSDLAKSIKDSGNFHMVIELLQDHDSILSYLTYATLCFEAIPPNFYAYLAGKGAAYFLAELILTIIMAIFTLGAGLAVRVASLVARVAASSAKVASAIKKLENAKKAFDAVIRFIEDFCDIAGRLRSLGDKLVEARSRGVKVKGSTKTTIEAERKTIKRNGKCACCQSASHQTPRGRLGTINYA
ncbi:hypothetical protein HA052_19345 [Chromobacterium haemolyticum]|uniref:Uncharacterized protein n=1 Tax=Chromobacterium fluminis TaxID=3044269 RepID=A0ABX0LDN0_9NEIS|nr:hypothetical protein [Chromobacterium haemolyticum]NHR07348.1 hypothetical protein [Chromobacterium haemolyticum]